MGCTAMSDGDHTHHLLVWLVLLLVSSVLVVSGDVSESAPGLQFNTRVSSACVLVAYVVFCLAFMLVFLPNEPVVGFPNGGCC